MFGAKYLASQVKTAVCNLLSGTPSRIEENIDCLLLENQMLKYVQEDISKHINDTNVKIQE